jgi:signal transduction histidine kinase
MSRRLDLLLFHSGVRPDLQRIDVIRVVDDAVEGMRAACRDRDYQVHHEVARMPMVGDPSRLLSVVENLLDNAVKATTRGQTILVRTTLDPGDPGQRPWVRLEVEDGGRGIPPERLEEIFEPGVALAPSGFGLGLSLAREIVRMHGGTISVESRPGRTVFQVKLPQFRSGSEEDDDGIDLAGIEQDEQE